jgi:hypothetical protein
MKIIFFLLPVLTFATSCSDIKGKKIHDSDLRTAGIKGNISSITMLYYSCDSTGKIGELQDCCIVLQEYNEDGNNAKQTSTNKEGKITEVETADFYSNGLRKSQTTIQNGKKARYIETAIDDSGRYTLFKFLDSSGYLQNYMTDLVINEFAQPVSFIFYNKDSSIIMKEESKYNGNKLTSYFQTDKTGKRIATYELKYNDKGELIAQIVIALTESGEKKTVSKYTYDGYDDNGNWLKLIKWNDNDKAMSIEKREFTYRK